MKSRMTWPTMLAAGIVAPLVLLTAACGGTTKDAAAGGSSGGTASGGDIVLGASLSMTGPLGQFGTDLQSGYQQKVSEINAAGGLDVGGSKHIVTLTVLDNRSDPNTATQQIRELVLKDNVVALLGACTPPIVVPEALAAEQQKVPYVSSCNPVQAFQGGNPSGWNYAWDLFFDETEQAAAVMKLLSTGGQSNKKVAIFTDTEPDGVAERGQYITAAQAAGLEVVGDYSFPVGTTDYASFINDAKANGAELVAGQMIPPDGIALWKQMKSLTFAPVAAFVAKASSGQSWTQALGPIAEGSMSDSFWTAATGKANSLDLEKTLGAQYPNNLGDLNIAVLGYTVAAIMTDAITSAGTTDPEKVNTAIGATSGDYPLGTISFDAKTHTAATPYLVTQWQGGNTVQVVPSDPAVTIQWPAQGLQ